MRIEAYNQVAQLYATNKTTKASSTSKTQSARDVFQMSSAGKDLQVAKQAVAEASDIREDKVAEMKQKLEAGNYQVDAGDFASVLLAKYNNEL